MKSGHFYFNETPDFSISTRQLSEVESRGKQLAVRKWGPHADMLGVARETITKWLADTTNGTDTKGGKTDHRKKLTEAADAETAERLDAGEVEPRGPSPVVLPRDDLVNSASVPRGPCQTGSSVTSSCPP